MRSVDMRKLPAAAQEERRRQVVGLRQRGLAYRAIAEQVGLSRTGVIDICRRFAAEGAKGLVSKARGRKPGEQRLLDAAQEAEVQRSTRLNSSHANISYAVFCLKKKNIKMRNINYE